MIAQPLQADDEAVFLRAHREVFGGAADAAWFAWKYSRGGGHGWALWDGPPGEASMAAFCGGRPRRLWDRGTRRQALQIGDVMVRAPWRTGGRRRGAFHQVSQGFYSTYLGAGRPYEWGFGFPSHRHLKLAAALGLLHDAGAMISAVWAACPQGLGAWQLKPLQDDAPGRSAVAHAWRAMRTDSMGWVLGERDAAGVMWRHAQRPRAPGKPPVGLWAVHRPWRTAPLGVAVVDTAHADGVAHWLDWVGPPCFLPLGLQAARQVAGAAGCREVHAWMSMGPWETLGCSGTLAFQEVARIGVPVASTLSAHEARTQPWWFMGADTDFL